jgi:hypothetical protein
VGEVAAAEVSVAGSTATKGLRVGVGECMESRRGRAHTNVHPTCATVRVKGEGTSRMGPGWGPPQRNTQIVEQVSFHL